MRRTPQACSRSTTKSPTFISRLRTGGKRCVCLNQTLLLEFGPEIRRDLGLQRIPVFLNLLRASSAHAQSDSDVRRRRELKRGSALINPAPGRWVLELLSLFDRGCGNLEVFFAVVVPRFAVNEAGIERRADHQR